MLSCAHPLHLAELWQIFAAVPLLGLWLRTRYGR